MNRRQKLLACFFPSGRLKPSPLSERATRLVSSTDVNEEPAVMPMCCATGEGLLAVIAVGDHVRESLQVVAYDVPVISQFEVRARDAEHLVGAELRGELGIAEAGHNLHRDPRVQGAEALENAGNPVDAGARAGAELHAAGGEPRQAADDLRERLISADDALRVGQKCLPAPVNSQPLLPRKNSGTDSSFSILERLWLTADFVRWSRSAAVVMLRHSATARKLR